MHGSILFSFRRHVFQCFLSFLVCFLFRNLGKSVGFIRFDGLWCELDMTQAGEGA